MIYVGILTRLHTSVNQPKTLEKSCFFLPKSISLCSLKTRLCNDTCYFLTFLGNLEALSSKLVFQSQIKFTIFYLRALIFPCSSKRLGLNEHQWMTVWFCCNPNFTKKIFVQIWHWQFLTTFSKITFLDSSHYKTLVYKKVKQYFSVILRTFWWSRCYFQNLNLVP